MGQIKIKPYKSKYHKYLMTFPYDSRVVATCKVIQQDVDWRAFSFYKDEKECGWAFSDLENVLPELKRYFTLDIDPKVAKDASDGAFLAPDAILTDNLADDLDIPTLKPLFPFQKEAVDFCDKAGGKALLALPMGSGKTICAIGYAAYKRYGRVLVICPASVKENWKREIKMFSGVDAKILTDEDSGGWEIINYDQLQKYAPYFKKQNYDLIICDESQKIKNKKAIRSKEALKILKRTKDALFLSGTPIMNRPLEIYTTFNFITPTNYWQFCMKFCGAKETSWGWDLNGASNLDELKERMWWMYRKTKEEILPDLPEKTINVLETQMKEWKEYKQVLNDFRQWLIDKDLSTNALYAEALTKVNYLKQVVVKNKNIKEIIDDFLESDKKIIVFSQYKGVINDLQKQYENSVKLTGETPVNSRQDLVDDFQNSKDVRIFFSTIQAGGVGLNLTAADTVVFTDMLWNPATHHQAEDRAHRIGTKSAVSVYYLITPDTIEEKIWKLLRRKEVMVNKIMAGDENVRKVHIKSLFKNL